MKKYLHRFIVYAGNSERTRKKETKLNHKRPIKKVPNGNQETLQYYYNDSSESDQRFSKSTYDNFIGDSSLHYSRNI